MHCSVAVGLNFDLNLRTHRLADCIATHSEELESNDQVIEYGIII